MPLFPSNFGIFILIKLAVVLLLNHSLNAIQTIHKNDSPYLINDSNKKHFTGQYSALDQCFPKKYGQKIGSFALTFKIMGKCTKGLLFCYPGSLDQSSGKYNYGMTIGTGYTVKNQPNNSIASECAEKQRSVCASKEKTERRFCKRGTIWHGIRMSGPFDAKKFHLEMSIAKQKYEFELFGEFGEDNNDQQQMRILFGNRRNLFTILTDQFGRQITFLGHDDDKIRDEYMAKRVDKGTKLSNHVGLWLLGLDLLPMLSRRTMDLHMYRDCTCDFHAWFHQPYEIPNVPKIMGYPPVPNECEVARDKAEEFELELKKTVKIGNRLQIKFRLAKNPNCVLIRLFDLFGTKHRLTFCMKITTKLIILTSEQCDCKKDNANELNNNVEKIKFEHLQMIIVDGQKLGNYFPWPNEWFETYRRTEEIQRVTLQGDIYKDIANVSINDSITPFKSVLPSVLLEEPAFAGSTINFRAQIKENAERVRIYLLQNAFQINDYIGNAILLLQINFLSDEQQANLEIKYQKWDEETKLNKWYLYSATEIVKLRLSRGDPFEVFIHLKDKNQTNNFQALLQTIEVNLETKKGSTLFELEEAFLNEHFVTCIGVDGDVVLFTSPIPIKIKKTNQPIISSKIEMAVPFHFFDPFLSENDSVEILGALTEDSFTLHISLLHETTLTEKKESNVPLDIGFFMVNGDHLARSKMYLRSFSKKMCNGICKEEVLSSKLFVGSQFKIVISVMQNSFEIFIHGARVVNFVPILPTWSGNMLSIEGNLKTRPTIKVKRHRQNVDKMPFILKVSDSVRNKQNKCIVIHGKTVKPYKSVNISLLYGALEASEFYGQLVLQMNFSTTKLNYAFYNKKDEKTIELPSLIEEEKLFILNITVKESQIESHLNNDKLFTGHSILPNWAIQYIRIDGNIKIEGNGGDKLVMVNGYD